MQVSYEYRPRATKPTPVLNEYGRDLTEEARKGELPEIVGRDQEIELIAEIICRRTKRNPALVGPAGTGKTAIVEGLAQRIVAGRVPEPLRGARLVELQPSNLSAGAGVVGELEKRMKAVLAEASQEGIILFIDEVHTIVGTGGHLGVSDVGAQLKPHLARGSIACIGATTDDEFRRFIEADRALERRFNRVRVQEMNPETTRIVLDAHRAKLEELRGVVVADRVLDWLLDFSGQFLKNRFFPDKAVDLLEQCVAHAVARGEERVDLDDAHHVAERMVGMPVGLDDRLGTLEERLEEFGLLDDDDADSLVGRLNVTMRGLDVRPERPNAVLLLLGTAAALGEPVARVAAESLFGGAERVVEIDFGALDDPHHANTLLGPPPGYVGHGERRPLHAVAQMPWSVLLCKNVDGCHPEIASTLQQALADGVVTERDGNRIYLSDTIVVMTAASGARSSGRPIGFGPGEDATSRSPLGTDPWLVAERALGQELLGQVDVVSTGSAEADEGQRRWVERSLLDGLVERYRQRGAELAWDDSFVDWVIGQGRVQETRSDLVRHVEDRLGGVLIPRLPEAGGPRVRASVSAKRDAIRVEIGPAEEDASEEAGPADEEAANPLATDREDVRDETEAVEEGASTEAERDSVPRTGGEDELG